MLNVQPDTKIVKTYEDKDFLIEVTESLEEPYENPYWHVWIQKKNVRIKTAIFSTPKQKTFGELEKMLEKILPYAISRYEQEQTMLSCFDQYRKKVRDQERPGFDKNMMALYG